MRSRDHNRVRGPLFACRSRRVRRTLFGRDRAKFASCMVLANLVLLSWKMRALTGIPPPWSFCHFPRQCASHRPSTPLTGVFGSSLRFLSLPFARSVSPQVMKPLVFWRRVLWALSCGRKHLGSAWRRNLRSESDFIKSKSSVYLFLLRPRFDCINLSPTKKGRFFKRRPSSLELNWLRD